MSLEIEKKFIVGNFTRTFEKLKKDFENYSHVVKHGFWWCNNYNGIENILNVINPLFSKKEVAIIKDIFEIIIPDQDFQFIRLRVNIDETNKYLLTFKIKSIVNKIEQNTEYEFEIYKNIFKRLVLFLQDTAFIFYYNIKESWGFSKNNINIELSKINDLRDSYLEIEALGDNEKELFNTIENALKDFSEYNIKEEPRSYLELSRAENKNLLKNLKLSQYSRKASIILQNFY